MFTYGMQAQNTADIAKHTGFNKGDSYFTAGYGWPGTLRSFSNIYFSAFTKNDIDYTNIKGPFYFKYEYGLTQNIGLGINCAFEQFTQIKSELDSMGIDTIYTEKGYFTSASFIARLNIHAPLGDRFDSYGGLGIGYKYDDFHTESQPRYAQNFPIGLDATLGLRYFPVKNIALYTEVGFAKSILQIGITAAI